MPNSAQNRAIHASNKLNTLVKSSPGKMGGASEKLMQTSEYKNAKNEYNKAAKAERDYNSSPEGKQAIKDRSKLSIIERQKLRKKSREDSLGRRN